jgi:hypothetical protein
MRLLGGSWHPAGISAGWFLRNVLASAEQLVQHIIRAYSEPKLAAEEIPSTSKRQDPLRECSYIRRAELEAMQHRLR